jgi:UDP-N-acetylmuramoyl-tripeptide--D-alanyl-D-alanine ligase
MISVSLSWIAKKVEGQLNTQSVADLKVKGVSTDTRTMQPGDLFIALVGPNHNAHEHLHKALEKGACAIIVSEPVDCPLPLIKVDDTKLALGRLGAAVKAKVSPKTVGITGSSGKTTVKEMVASILSVKGKVLATQGNFNNDIGVPLTLLRLNESHEYAVIEMGANHLGEIAYTTHLSKPDVATIVNAAASHLEGFGSLFGVARAKSEIFKGLGESGTAILNSDSQFFEFWKGKTSHINTLTFSPESDAGDFKAEDIAMGMDGCAEFELVCPKGKAAIRLSIPGTHNVGNALLAAALSLEVGASLEDVQLGLFNMKEVSGRLNVKQLTQQVRILDDTYNANVASVNAAIDLLSTYSGIKVLVLGDMAELGDQARYYHEQVGEYALAKGITLTYTTGVLSQCASAVFNDAGAHFEHLEALVTSLENTFSHEQQDITILVKGSRSSKMELVVKGIEDSCLGKLERRRERIAC